MSAWSVRLGRRVAEVAQRMRGDVRDEVIVALRLSDDLYLVALRHDGVHVRRRRGDDDVEGVRRSRSAALIDVELEEDREGLVSRNRPASAVSATMAASR